MSSNKYKINLLTLILLYLFLVVIFLYFSPLNSFLQFKATLKPQLTYVKFHFSKIGMVILYYNHKFI